MQAFNVYLRGKLIDTVFYSRSANADCDEVKRSLVNHDGYNPDIVVRIAGECGPNGGKVKEVEQ